MEDEVADGGVKRLVGIVQVSRIAFLKMDAGSDALDCRIFFALLFGVVPPELSYCDLITETVV